MCTETFSKRDLLLAKGCQNIIKILDIPCPNKAGVVCTSICRKLFLHGITSSCQNCLRQHLSEVTQTNAHCGGAAASSCACVWALNGDWCFRSVFLTHRSWQGIVWTRACAVKHTLNLTFNLSSVSQETSNLKADFVFVRSWPLTR